MSQRNLTARDMLRFQTCERLLGCSQLTPDARYEQALTAQRMRNFWTTATYQARIAHQGDDLIARTPAFSEPLIITDLISLFDFGTRSSLVTLLMEAFEYGGQERSEGLDCFGLSGKVPMRYILKHEKNRSIVSAAMADPQGDLQGRWIACVPRLFTAYQQLEFRYAPVASDLFLQTGVRGVRVLLPDNPYSYFTASTDREIKNYISGSVPETFFLEANLPRANFPATGATVVIKTPQMERPLLILGATSNLEGAQAELSDESKYYMFTFPDDPISKVAGMPLYKAPPLALWACNSDFRNYNIYNMWPVPHLLERGAQLVIKLTNGLTPDQTGTFSETMLTRSEQAARITFICRTV